MRNQKYPIEQQWDMVIKPKSTWYDINLEELWRYRELIGMFVKRDFVTFYKQTILGPLWYIIQPVFTSLIFTVVFGNFAKIPTDDIPPFLFYMAGNIIWGYFAYTLDQTSNTFIANASIFGKVYFPRLTIPVGIIVSGFIQFAIQFTLFLGFYLYFMFKETPITPSWWILAMPLLLLQMALLGLGMGILISSLTTKYRDLRFAMGFLIQVWMYATPIVYPLTQVPEKYRMFYACNPMVAIVESFRYAFLGSGVIQWSYVILGWVVTLTILMAGIILFSRIEKTFMDTV